MKFQCNNTLVNIVVTNCLVQGTKDKDSTGRAIIKFDAYYNSKFVSSKDFKDTYISSKLQNFIRNTLNGKRALYWEYNTLSDEAQNNKRYNSIIDDLNNLKLSKTPNQDINILIEKIKEYIIPNEFVD